MVPSRAEWLALALAEGIGPARYGHLLRGEVDQEQIDAWLRMVRAQVAPERVATLQESCERDDITLLTPADGAYPAALRNIPDPPAALFLRGDARLLAEPQIAIVGTRRASQRGLADARWLAGELAVVGLVVTSGLALGIDGAAHRGALAADGPTIAVLGGGLDHVTPVRHRRLAERILESGLLVSELPPDQSPEAYHFPRRNRIISGLSLGVVVVEAAGRSGSLITARLAAEQGRDVYAMPATARDPGGVGCHRLLREGAHLLTSLDDVLEELSAEVLARLRKPLCPEAVEQTHAPATVTPESELLAALDADGTVFDDLLLRLGLDAATLGQRLLELELDGRVARQGERWMRVA